jgi:uncharacterized membrane protein HdeD (DUF308 family)
MDQKPSQEDNFENIAWGALFIWWGAIMLFDFLPDGLGALGTGLILLGVNFARRLKGLPTRSLTTTLGILALAWGVSELANSIFRLPFEMPSFAIVLIVLGMTSLVREFQKPGSEPGGQHA